MLAESGDISYDVGVMRILQVLIAAMLVVLSLITMKFMALLQRMARKLGVVSL
jgi:hypothetical protein